MKCFSKLKNGAEWPCSTLEEGEKRQHSLLWFWHQKTFSHCSLSATASVCLCTWSSVKETACQGCCRHVGGCFHMWAVVLCGSIDCFIGWGKVSQSGVKSLGLMMCAKQPLVYCSNVAEVGLSPCDSNDRILIGRWAIRAKSLEEGKGEGFRGEAKINPVTCS